MRYKKVLLVDPFYYFGYAVPPVGLGYIAEALKRHNLEYEVLDMTLGYKPGDLFKMIKYFCPDLLGLSMMSLMYKDTYSMIEYIKKIEAIDIVCGGPHISIFREEALRECKAIDYGIVYEGEETIIELCEDRELGEVKGLLYRKDGEIVYNSPRPFNEDLDSVNFPSYENFQLPKYVPKQVSISTSRGCPFNCIYCSANLITGGKMRMRSAENIFQELSFWYDKGYRVFRIIDDSFTLNRNRVIEIVQAIRKGRWKDVMFTCTNGIRVDSVDYELLKEMREVGFKRLTFGVESGNDRVLQHLKKRQSVDVIKKAIGDACKLGYDVTLFFIVGSPYEGWKEVLDSTKLALEFPIFNAYFFSLRPYPKTELYSWVEKNGYFVFSSQIYLNRLRLIDSEKYPFFWTRDFTFKERKRVLRYTAKISRKIASNTLKRKLTRFRILKYPVAFIATLSFFQRLVRHNRILKFLAYKFLFEE